MNVQATRHGLRLLAATALLTPSALAQLTVEVDDGNNIAYNGYLPYAARAIHSSHLGLCLNYVGQRVPC